MIYYIINKKIIGFEKELDSELYNYQQLTESQATFYENNHRATLTEILAEQLNVKTAEEILQEAKQTKLQELQSYIETAIEGGLVIDNITYPIHDSAITNMNVILNTFNTEVNLNTYVNTDTKYLIDNDYQTQQVTKDSYRSAILQCINFREQLHFLKASKTAEINACTTVAEVEAVSW